MCVCGGGGKYKDWGLTYNSGGKTRDTAKKHEEDIGWSPPPVLDGIHDEEVGGDLHRARDGERDVDIDPERRRAERQTEIDNGVHHPGNQLRADKIMKLL